jgi:hypothetical protein
MAQEILVNEQIEPGLELLKLVEQRLPIKVAFWMKEPDRDRPYLFIATDAANDGNWRDAAAVVYELVDQVGGYGIDSTSVNVIGSDDPLVPETLALRIDDPKRRTRALGSYRLGRTYADDLYVYPPLHPQPAAVA